MWCWVPIGEAYVPVAAVAGALVLTAPRIGAIRFEEAVSSIDWTLLLFMAASLVGGGLAA